MELRVPGKARFSGGLFTPKKNPAIRTNRAAGALILPLTIKPYPMKKVIL